MNMPLSSRSTTDPAALKLADDERQPCEVWTRVMGYHRPVSSFNIGKKGEFAERVYFTEPGKPAWTGRAPAPIAPAPIKQAVERQLVEAAA